MGSCISKYRPKKKFKRNYSNDVQEKLVLSQDHKNPIFPSSLPIIRNSLQIKNKISPEPSSLSSSSASLSSFSGSVISKSNSSVSSASSTCFSSALISKDRIFSNEFLYSCMKENPHVVGLKPIITKENNLGKPPPLPPQVKQSTQEKRVSTPNKRARSNSPTIVRQKSFRKDQTLNIPNRCPRSPSPNRRFNGIPTVSPSRRPILPKASSRSSVSSNVQRESLKGPLVSPNRDMVINRKISMRRRDGVATQEVGRVHCSQEMDAMMELDVNNPLIALDCFIFL